MITKIKINQKEKSLKPLSRKKKKVIVKKKQLMSSECYFHFSIVILNIVYLTLQFHLMFSFYRGDVSSPGYFHVAAVGV